jgi:hypothetical protein
MDPVVDVACGTCHFAGHRVGDEVLAISNAQIGRRSLVLIVVAALLLLRIVPTRLALKRQ